MMNISYNNDLKLGLFHRIREEASATMKILVLMQHISIPGKFIYRLNIQSLSMVMTAIWIIWSSITRLVILRISSFNNATTSRVKCSNKVAVGV